MRWRLVQYATSAVISLMSRGSVTTESRVRAMRTLDIFQADDVGSHGFLARF